MRELSYRNLLKADSGHGNIHQTLQIWVQDDVVFPLHDLRGL